ncbi:hypothetical protein PGN35_005155 [Nodosilinea sp. PGN35]|uniref:hypothetical protein n=1 Tax=Nodosilinea sp. PGN35 TaxID=3020489 RepID=UPI0023B2249C|nr:hypothetical protein [Nodosilinea sp. TSF1-S3]MDF0367625.1 hypothetical protein [Nodosilinea sp. TSF1-S3]
MFEYLEPDSRGASNPPPSSHSNPQTHPEKVRHLLYGSLAAIDRTIKILHAYGYADPNDWSDPIPVPPGGGVSAASPAMPWMVILTKTLLIEE